MKLASLDNILLNTLFLLFPLILAEFNPDVRWSCSPSSVSIFVSSNSPFEGLISPRGISVEDCITKGIGTNMAVLKLDLEAQRCGIRYDEELDLYSLTVDIHSHPILIVDDDKTVNITCKGKSNSTRSKDRDSKDFALVILDNGLPTQEVEYAKKYSIQIHSLLSQSVNIQIGVCTTTGAGNMTVELTDIRGCSILPSLLSDFSRTNSGVIATIPSMFRFPITEQITFTCQVSICGRRCEENDCSHEGAPISWLLDRTTTTIDFDDEQYVSTTVTIFRRKEEVPSTISSLNLSTGFDAQCPKPIDVDLMYSLCIFLSVCSTVGFFLNIFLCCLLRRKRMTQKNPSSHRGKSIMGSTNDFWIMDQVKQEPSFFDERRNSGASYASVKQKPRRSHLPNIDYGGPASRSSDGSSEFRGDIYRRPEVRHSNSTFMTPSSTMETDLDSSPSSNQASSYH